MTHQKNFWPAMAAVGLLLSTGAAAQDSVPSKPRANYVCAVQRWHYSGQAGTETLAVVDSYSTVSASSGYLYGRSDHDLDEYSVWFDFSYGELRYSVSRDPDGNYNHAAFQLTDPELYHCPFIMMTEVGALYMDQQEAAALRDYLLKGGFLWADDFWGEYAWSVFRSEMSKALPEAQIVDLPLSHSLFHMLYQVNKVPQIPSINNWFGLGGGTSERGADSAIPHARAIFNDNGDLMVLITFNTDFGDAFEREGDNRAYFDTFAGVGYAFGINALLYSMSH